MGKPQAPSLNIKISYRPRPSRWSLNRCLLVLGARRVEIFIHYRDRLAPTLKLPPFTQSSRTIYSRYTIDELSRWVKTLWNVAKVKYHPDAHQQKPAVQRFYTRKFQQTHEAFQAAKQILERRGAEFD